MRRFFLVIAFLGVSFAQSNLVQNPSFESWTNGIPDNWSKEGGVNIYQESNEVHSGTYSVKLEATESDNRGIYQTVTGISEGATYTISFWVYSISGTGSGGIGIYLTWQDNNGNSVGTSGPYYNTQTNQWEQVSRDLQAPDGATQLLIKIRAYANSTVAGYIDDVNVSLQGNRPPSISNVSHSPQNPTSSDNVTITATITDPDGDNISVDYLKYSVDGGTNWTQVNHSDVSGDTYTYVIPAQQDGSTVQYYIYAEDNQGNGSTSSTYSYTVNDNPLNPPIINEIMYNPSTSAGSDTHLEYVEIFNPNDQDYDVSNWVVTDGESNFTIPTNTSIPPYGYLVVARDTDSIIHFYGPTGLNLIGDGDDAIVGNATFSLSNSGDQVILKNSAGAIVDSVEYDNSGVWPSEPDGSGPSLGLKDPSLDNGVAANWCSDEGEDPTYGGTPGAENGCGNVVLNGDFENWTNGNPDHWNVENGASIQEDTNDKHRGQRCTALSVTTDGSGLYQNIEQVIGGNTYNLSLWVKAAGNVNSHPSVGIELKFYNGNWNYISTDGPFFPSSSGGWGRIAHEGTIPGNATKMRIHIIGYSTSKGTAGNVDAVSFISAGAVATGIGEHSINNNSNGLKIIENGHQITFLMGDSGSFTIEIFNAAGQKIYKNVFTSKLSIRTSFLRKGVYFAIIKSKNRIVSSGKFVVLR